MSTVNMSNINDMKQIAEKEKDAFSKLTRRISPGNVYWCNLGDLHEQYNKYMIKKIRPCIILSDDSEDMKKDVFTCLPIKTLRGDYENMYFITKKIDLGDIDSLVCLDQIRPINRKSIFECIGTLTPSQRELIDDYVEEHLEMNIKFRKIKEVMRNNNLSPDDVIQILLSTLSCSAEVEKGDTPSGQSCVPFEMPQINLR